MNIARKEVREANNDRRLSRVTAACLNCTRSGVKSSSVASETTSVSKTGKKVKVGAGQSLHRFKNVRNPAVEGPRHWRLRRSNKIGKEKLNSSGLTTLTIVLTTAHNRSRPSKSSLQAADSLGPLVVLPSCNHTPRKVARQPKRQAQSIDRRHIWCRHSGNNWRSSKRTRN